MVGKQACLPKSKRRMGDRGRPDIMKTNIKTKKRILVDLEICYKCKRNKNSICDARCSYFYSSRGPHAMTSVRYGYQSELPPENNGVEKILAKAQQFLVCRKCEEPFCIDACTKEALEKDENGILQRHLFRCISCKNCSAGCPFGTIYLELLNYRSSTCDYCIDRCDDNKPPLCVETCPDKALKFVEVEESKEKNIYTINDNLAVCVPKWNAAE